MKTFYYYTTALNMEKLFSSLAIFPEKYYKEMSFSSSDLHYIDELKPFREFIPLFAKNNFQFDLSNSLSLDQSSMVIIELRINGQNTSSLHAFNVDNNVLVANTDLDSADIVLVNGPFYLYKISDIKKISFSNLDIKKQTFATCEMTSQCKGLEILKSKLKGSLPNNNLEAYPYKSLNIKNLPEYNPSKMIKQINQQNSYGGLAASLQFANTFDSEPIIKDLKKHSTNIINLIALKNPSEQSRAINENFESICSLIDDEKLDNIPKELSDFNQLYQTIETEKKLDKDFDTWHSKGKNTLKKLFKADKLAEELMEMQQKRKDAKGYFYEKMLGLNVIEESKKYNHLRKEQIQYLEEVADKKNAGVDLDYEKLHLTLARHSPIYAKILIEDVYIGYFDNIRSYTDENVSNIKDLLHHLDKRIHELISSGSKNADIKAYSAQKYDFKENTINIKFNRKNLPLNLDEKDLEYFQCIINHSATYYNETGAFIKTKLVGEDKLAIVTHIGKKLKDQDDKHVLLGPLREIAKYFQNPFEIIQVENIILKCFYDFLMNPDDLEKLLSSIDDTDQIFITSAFFGIISGFTLMNGRDFETFAGSSNNFNKMLKYIYKIEQTQSRKPANKKTAKKKTSSSKSLKAKKAAGKKDKLPGQSNTSHDGDPTLFNEKEL